LARIQGSGSRTAALNSALRRGLILTIILGVLGAALGAVIGMRLASAHSATAIILVNPLDGNPFSTRGSGDDLINLQTEAQLVQSEDVGRLVQQEVGGGTSVPAILSGLTVTIPPNTQILQLDYSATNGAEAVRRAQAFADNYLAYRETRAKNLISNQARRISEQIAERTKEQSDLAKRLNGRDPQSSTANVLRVQLEAVTTQLNQLQARSAELQAGSTNPGQIVTPAALPAPGLIGSWVIYALAGLLVGVALAVLLALLRSRVDNRIRHVDDIATAGHVLLGEVSQRDAATARAGFTNPASGAALPDAFKELRVSLLTTEHRRPAVIVLATATQTHDSPVTAAGLALATATSNLRTVVVEAVDSQLSSNVAGESSGLARVLAGEQSARAAMVPVRSHLNLIPNGNQVGVDDLFMAPEMHRLVNDLRGSADIVLIVTGNIHDPRSKALADVADSVILEAREGMSSYRDLYRASNDYALLTDKLLGVVYVSHSRFAGSPRRSSSDRPAWSDWQLPAEADGKPALPQGSKNGASESTPTAHAQ
jgi:capsular polysaccharide biosynthesis protein